MLKEKKIKPLKIEKKKKKFLMEKVAIEIQMMFTSSWSKYTKKKPTK